MLYFDYTWDLSPEGILLDEELNVNKLKWSAGDYFKLVETTDGKHKLVKVNELEAFILLGATKNIDNNKKRE